MSISVLTASRRAFLGLVAGGVALATAGLPVRAARISAKARIGIIGAGAAGTAILVYTLQSLLRGTDPRGTFRAGALPVDGFQTTDRRTDVAKATWGHLIQIMPDG